MMKKKIDIIVPSWIPAVFLCPWVIPSYDASRYIHCSILFHHLYSVWEKDQRGNNFSNDEYLYVLIIKKTNIQWTYVTTHTHYFEYAPWTSAHKIHMLLPPELGHWWMIYLNKRIHFFPHNSISIPIFWRNA